MASSSSEGFSPDTLVRDVLTAHPEAASVLDGFGLGCTSCLAAEMDTLAEVAAMHDLDLDVLLGGLNALLKEDAGD